MSFNCSYVDYPPFEGDFITQSMIFWELIKLSGLSKQEFKIYKLQWLIITDGELSPAVKQFIHETNSSRDDPSLHIFSRQISDLTTYQTQH